MESLAARSSHHQQETKRQAVRLTNVREIVVISIITVSIFPLINTIPLRSISTCMVQAAIMTMIITRTTIITTKLQDTCMAQVATTITTSMGTNISK